jgi:hypothetical protein
MMPIIAVIGRSRLRLYAIAVVLTSPVAAGCGKPEPLRSRDPARAREALLKKSEEPGRPPGPPTSRRAR